MNLYIFANNELSFILNEFIKYIKFLYIYLSGINNILIYNNKYFNLYIYI